MRSIDFYPYPLILGLLILAWVIFRQRKRGWLYLSTVGLFGIYLLAVINKIAFPIRLPDRWPAFQTWDEFAFTLSTMVNLIPGNYGNMFSDLAAGMIGPNIIFWEIFGNILLTVPFGLGVSLFSPMPGRRIIGWALAAGLTLEGIQFLIMVGIGPNTRAVDINDVLLNALGVLVGYAIYRAAAFGSRWVKVKFAQEN